MTAKRPLPKRHNPLLLPDMTPQQEILVERRRLGQTNLAVKPGQVGTSNATKPENLGMFDYAHLRAPLPKDLKGSEIFAPQHGQPHPESYFLMRRSHDGFLSATGMFKASFPWAKHSEEEAERKYLKSLPTTSEDEVAGNVWIPPTFALELAEDYQIKPWIQALLDPEPMDKGATDLKKSISPPPKFTFSANDNNSILPPPTPRGRGRPRSRSPSKVATPSKKLTAPRNSRSMKAANAATAREASASLQAALDSAATMGDSESVDVDRFRVEVDSAVDVNGDIEVTTTSVKVEMAAGSPEMPLEETTEQMIAKAKEMVEKARRLDGGEPSGTKSAKRKIDELDDTEDTEEEKSLQPAKRSRMLERELKKERVQKRALTGIVATLVIGSIIPYVL
ncbi:MAG: hypothetical protein M1830_001961 [Pleopsidium flavum]|nr:MAG: hypothetical protein M1830_001961 [Pleopsidium flavum]